MLPVLQEHMERKLPELPSSPGSFSRSGIRRGTAKNSNWDPGHCSYVYFLRDCTHLLEDLVKTRNTITGTWKVLLLKSADSLMGSHVNWKMHNKLGLPDSILYLSLL
jgi:hypothetical protein